MNPVKSFREWRLQRSLDKARGLLLRIDILMKRMGMPRQKQRQMWRDFIKSENQRKNMISILGNMT